MENPRDGKLQTSHLLFKEIQMASVNKVILVGNCGRDPEIKYLPSGMAVCDISIATSSKRKDKSGEYVEETQWHRVDVFGKLAAAVKDFVSKGRQVYIEGQLVYDQWIDKSGTARTSPKIKVGFNGKLMLLGKGSVKENAPDNTHPEPEERAGSVSGSGVEIPYKATDDEIPF